MMLFYFLKSIFKIWKKSFFFPHFYLQVYIVAVNREKEKTGPAYSKIDESEVQEFPVESLLSLVQPELSNLSEHWMSALKDYALLSLPPGNCSLSLIFYAVYLGSGQK